MKSYRYYYVSGVVRIYYTITIPTIKISVYNSEFENVESKVEIKGKKIEVDDEIEFTVEVGATSEEEAKDYVEEVLSNPDYWVWQISEKGCGINIEIDAVEVYISEVTPA